jgi:MarR family transcriptional regulator, lower aerobic nicotinate degradation pathway regulator
MNELVMSLDLMPADEATALWERPGFLVRRLHQISVAIFMDEMDGIDITPVQFGALSIVEARPGIDQSTLARDLGIDRANVADVVARLVAGGHIVRKPSKTDRRVKTIFITDQGAQHLREANRRFSRVHRRLLQPLSSGERETFLELLMRLIEGNNSLGRAVLRLEGRGVGETASE